MGVSYKEFMEHYERWLSDCREELMEIGIDPLEVEICENGQVYFGNLEMTSPEFVTPWEESEHYIK